MILILILLMIIYYGSFAKIMCYMFSVTFIVYVVFNLVLYKLYAYLKHIKAIEKKPLFETFFSEGNTIKRCLMSTSMCTIFPLERCIIKAAFLFIYQLYKGELDKRVLFFSCCFIMFNCFMQDYYCIFFSYMTLDILVCHLDPKPPTNSSEPLGLANHTLYPLNLRDRVDVRGNPFLAHIATERVKHLPYDRKIEIMEQIRVKLLKNPSPDLNKLPLLTYEQLGLLKNLCSEATLRNRTP